jgi:hypothetical protein
MSDFIGRKEELTILNEYLQKNTASFLVVRGRRRIGKSRLIEEFAKPYKFISISGIAPNGKTTAQSQRDEFASQLSQFGFPKIAVTDWNDLFWLLSERVKRGRVIILFDEISWMGSKDPDFLGKLKNLWDLQLKKNSRLIFIICGSASSWIEKNILNNTNFLGRVSYTLTLEELPIKKCKNFWGAQEKNISGYEKLKILSVVGGVPRYLEEVKPGLGAEENIRKMCFQKGAFLVDEFDRIFANVFLRKSEVYKDIVTHLSTGSKEFKEICGLLKKEYSGRILEYLEELELAGFVKRDYTWDIKFGQDVKLSKYRLSDNYLRFYLKYIKGNKTKIERSSFNVKTISALPGWESIMGLQFENLVLNNRAYIYDKLNIRAEDIVSENPYFQHETTKQKSCQIDYLIQTKFQTLYVCEIKFSKNIIPLGIIEEVQKKIDRLKKPKGMSCRPVVIHVNEVSESVKDSGYFAAIIDLSQIFEDD